MTFRFFRSALSAILLGALPLAAQTAAPPVPGATPAPEEKPKLGYLRFWNMLPEESGEFALVQETGGGEPTTLIAAPPLNVYAGYVSTKPGRYALKVVRTADPKTVIKTFDLILKADVYVTFYAKSDGGKLSLEMLDDTYDPLKTLSGKVTVRQMIKDATVTIKSAALQQPLTLAFGEEKTLDNMPLKSVLFQSQVTLEGKTKSWSNEVNFKNTPHASIFLVQDVYGRFRPRASIDGQTDIDYSKH